MTKLQDFRVEFDKPNYSPGEVVSGRVVIKLSGPKNVRQIKLEACGGAENHWTEEKSYKDSDGHKKKRTEHFTGTEHYFSVSNRLLGGSTGEDQVTLRTGEHSYNFSFHLPANIPCSFEHQYGYIRYTVKAILDRPWRFDHKVERTFVVVSPYDLNTQPNLAVGITDDIRSNFNYCCCLFRMGEMTANVRSRASGFVPGETIELIIDYNFYSDKVNLTKIKLKLQKQMIFYASTPSPDKKMLNEIVKKIKVETEESLLKRGQATLRITVPPLLPPSRLEHCSIINISYKLILELCVSRFHCNVKRTYPIEIGTTPIFQRPNNPEVAYLPTAPPLDYTQSQIQQVPQAPVQPIGFVVMAPPYPNTAQSIPEMPPPSYEECVTGKSNISHQGGQEVRDPSVEFTPRYPVYQFPMPMPYPP